MKKERANWKWLVKAAVWNCVVCRFLYIKWRCDIYTHLVICTYINKYGYLVETIFAWKEKEKVERVESSRVFTWGCTARRRRGCSDVTWFSSSSRLGANTVLIGSFCRTRLPLLLLFFLFDFLPFLLISCILFCASTQEEKRKPGMH